MQMPQRMSLQMPQPLPQHHQQQQQQPQQPQQLHFVSMNIPRHTEAKPAKAKSKSRNPFRRLFGLSAPPPQPQHQFPVPSSGAQPGGPFARAGWAPANPAMASRMMMVPAGFPSLQQQQPQQQQQQHQQQQQQQQQQ
eukprot:RCo004581